MKFNEFMAALDRELKHVYLLSGDETFYIDRAREKILEKLCINRADLVTLDCGDKMSPAEVVNAIDSAPLFSPLNVVLVKNAPYFSAEGRNELLKNILSRKSLMRIRTGVIMWYLHRALLQRISAVIWRLSLPSR